MDISYYFKHWRDMTRFNRYDRWCEENYDWLVKEKLYNDSEDYSKFINGFKV
jgi:hypothetical protein|uniref:Uncharacterized protein n=1 Tax=viral metagenome TaxID=1070528 RepID=A0A6C0AZQ5_9ZZZZ